MKQKIRYEPHRVENWREEDRQYEFTQSFTSEHSGSYEPELSTL
ncbi:hypothetical protein ACFO4O_07015 [Glaciecola siphonariae]|uniref:Uncharacterized protein n=1 Tax=Glaciecola siphonariae TaxID=521012 RepID=A0ABV9LVA7_9ALTE